MYKYNGRNVTTSFGEKVKRFAVNLKYRYSKLETLLIAHN